MIFLYVSVVTMAGTLPVGFYLGRLYERERRPPAPHEALARVYQMPPKAPAERNIWTVRSVEGLRRFGVQTSEHLSPAEILAELRGRP